MQLLIVIANRYKTRVCVNTHVCVIQGPHPPGYDADIGNDDEEDSDYVPSNDDPSEDETMDTEVDADIWLWKMSNSQVVRVGTGDPDIHEYCRHINMRSFVMFKQYCHYVARFV